MMNVCLVNPILHSAQMLRGRTLRDNRSLSYYPPLGLCYIAAMLKKNGHGVKIIDRHALITKYRGDVAVVDEITRGEIVKYAPEIVGITTATATFVDVRNTLLPMIKTVSEDIKVVLGGSHASALPDRILDENEGVDIVCRGEGEFSMLEIASGKRLEDIPGISFRSGSEIVKNGNRQPFLNIDEFCYPARELVDMQYYCRANPVVMHGLYMRATTLYSSRGCAYDCNFCAGKVATGGGRVRYQSVDMVIEEIKLLQRDYDVQGIYFADDMFDVNRERADIICEKLIQTGLNRKVHIYPQIRVNNIDKGRLKLMKRAGVIRVDIGFESGSQKTLDAMNKRTTVEQNYRAARILHEMGLQFQANIIVGYPGEDEEDIRQTELLLRRTRPHWINFAEFLPLPGSRVYGDLEQKRLIRSEMLEYTRPYNLTNMDDKTFGGFIRLIMKKIVLPTRIISYLRYNIRRPMSYVYIAKLALETLRYRFFKRRSANAVQA
jgi:anaerobic magnesium-protoporphyrin IX monomethyl ester cyclase